ncbi:hypothetical protein [Phenylobacterium hankyongense]|uniref:hypothetical protein n=1 Tax=Phenylobacterium hankyongense TaxID=1813876 RepID=UPI001057F0E1|nr:hypothetical protein [Phenylobacterium hankyongense]
MVRRVAVRSPPGDTWRAAATLAYGALPFALYVPLWRELTTRTALLIAFPVLYVWGAVAIWMALRDTPPPQTPRMRSVMLAGASLIYAAVSLTLLGAAGFAILMRLWSPIEGTMVVSLLLVVPGLPLGALAGWASLNLFMAARVAQSSRDADAPTIS